MRTQLSSGLRRRVISLLGALVFALGSSAPQASDHLDTPTVIADPAADIGDLFAWTSSDGRRLNLIMTIVAHQFSDQLLYVFHVDSGAQFGKTTARTSIVCRFDAENAVECWAGDADHIRGDASKPAGLVGEKGRFKVFAGLRDDPFFNNVKGTRAALGVAAAALRGGAKVDAAGCASFDEATSQAIFDRWRNTEGGRATNFLAGWKSAALVISVDLDVVNAGGKQLAVWAGTHKRPNKNEQRVGIDARPTLGEQIERIGRALTANMLIEPLGPEDVNARRKETYNRAAPADWPQFATDIQRTLGLYDGYDRTCGNQWLADDKVSPSMRYQTLAKVLADDRLWINSSATECTQYLAVELSALRNKSSSSSDCGGRTPNYNANAVFRSLLIRGTTEGVDDGLERDDAVHSTTVFPFLAAPFDGAAASDKTNNANVVAAAPITTASSIAIANLDHLIAQGRDAVEVQELLLTRSRFLGDYDALDRATACAQTRFESGGDRALLRRARARSAVHRFADALDDLAAAEVAFANPDEIAALRASILIATGRAGEVIPGMEADVARQPTLISRTTLANAYAAVGRFVEADRMYGAALADLDTTSPFPYAWIYFARGLMWSEHAGDQTRGEADYSRALAHLPEFVAANIHLAEIETARGDHAFAMARLERVVASTDEPEALALLGELRVRAGDPIRGRSQISQAGQRYESLLAHHSLAFADHAAKFYLGPGDNAERAWELAQQNLASRETRASFALAIRAAQATNRQREVGALMAKAAAKFGVASDMKECALPIQVAGGELD